MKLRFDTRGGSVKPYKDKFGKQHPGWISWESRDQAFNTLQQVLTYIKEELTKRRS